jgi:subtilisin family serine protease
LYASTDNVQTTTVDECDVVVELLLPSSSSTTTSTSEFETIRDSIMRRLSQLSDGVAAFVKSERGAVSMTSSSFYFGVRGGASVAQMQALLRAVADEPLVLRVERQQRHKTFNKFAQWITQSGKKDERPVWGKGMKNQAPVHPFVSWIDTLRRLLGLRGEGQIVGCADTGVDYDHCFFNDDTQPSFSASHEKSPSHRKILAYFSVDGADYQDEVGGHGTHVAGSIVGNTIVVGSAEQQNTVSEYNGAAPQAKLVFHDIGASDGALKVNSPALGATVLRPAYELGARIHSNSWGCSGGPSICNVYDGGAAAVDEFVWNNRDMVVLFAAGNDGANGEVNS